MTEQVIGVIGGSGLYEMEGLTGVEHVVVDTPFGKPSAGSTSGPIGGFWPGWPGICPGTVAGEPGGIGNPGMPTTAPTWPGWSWPGTWGVTPGCACAAC